MRIVIASVLFALIVAGCGEDSRGVVITSDGKLIANTAEHRRDEIQNLITKRLDEAIAPHWRARVMLDRVPDQYQDGDRDVRDGWLWTRLAAEVELIGDGGGGLPETEAALRQAVERYLRPRLVRIRDLTVNLHAGTDAIRFAQLAGTVSAAAGIAPGVRAQATDVRRYVVQPGDTLADLSTVFYGTAKYWRLIVQANPDKWERLRAGDELVIPPLPAASDQ